MSTINFLKFGANPLIDLCNTLIEHKDSIDEKLVSPKAAEDFFKVFFAKRLKFDRYEFNNLLKIRTELKNIFYCLVSSTKTSVFNSKYLSETKLTISIHNKNQIGLSVLTHKEYESLILTELYNFLLNADTKRIKKCKNSNCSHLFYDKSKNNSRIWCSMKSCGNIMKSRNFYNKRKAKM